MFSTLLSLALLVSAPSFAGEEAAAPPSGLADAAGLITALTGLVAAGGAAAASWRKARAAEQAAARATTSASAAQAELAVVRADAELARREAAATAAMLEHFDAQNRGVCLVVTYETMPAESSAVAWIRSCGWTVVEYDMRQYGGADLPVGERWQRDLEAADCILFQGATGDVNERVALNGAFRESVRNGAGLLLLVPNADTRYKLALWGADATGVTNPRRAEIELRGIVAARRAMARHKGTQRGGLAEARAALPGADQ